MKKITRRRETVYILLFLTVISILTSGLFTVSHGHFYFEPTTKQPPYYPGSYENYSISASNLILNSHNVTGYLNVSSSSHITTLKIHAKFYYLSKPFFINKTVELTENGGKFYYNGTQVHLPFFYSGNVISSFRNIYINATQSDIYHSMITQSSLYHFHPGIYVYTNPQGDIFAASNKLLVEMQAGMDPVINYLLGVQIYGGNRSYPVGMILTLHSTSYIVFPVNWPYVAATFVVVSFAIGFPIIVPVAIVLAIASYRRRKRRKNGTWK